MPTLDGADKAFADSVNKLIGETGVGLSSGYRSNGEQQSLFDAAVKKYGSEDAARKYVAKPGGSNHEHGYAADISGYQNINDDVLAKYGLWRPMSWEPWHVEPLSTKNGRKQAASTTNPSIPDTPTTKALQQFSGVIEELFSNVGQQSSVVDTPTSAVDNQMENPASVAEAGTEVAQNDALPTTSNRAIGATATPANESAYASLFNAAGQKYGINPKILQEVARAESGFNPNAGSGAGAKGLMQFMPGTAKGLGIDPMDPQQAVDGAARLLSGYMEQYHGDLSKALAAYNAGPGAVQKYNGVPPYEETQNYVKKITQKVGA